MLKILSIPITFMVGSWSGLRSKELQARSNKVRQKSFILTDSTLGTARVTLGPDVRWAHWNAYNYEGEIDEDGKACGVGVAKIHMFH